METGVFGGTFNPVHLGHLRAAEEVRQALNLDRILWTLSARPPHKDPDLTEIASAEDRLNMVAMTIEGKADFELLDMEIRRPGPSYTLETLQELRRERPGDILYFVIGIDAFADLPGWHEPRELLRLAHFVVMCRPPGGLHEIWTSEYIAEPGDTLRERLQAAGGRPVRCATTVDGGLDIVLIDIAALPISATEIRRRLQTGQSVKGLLPAPVESYILNKGLYQSSARRTEP